MEDEAGLGSLGRCVDRLLGVEAAPEQPALSEVIHDYIYTCLPYMWTSYRA